MTSVTRYDPAEAMGTGRTIIEASAGTGKTFTIAAAVTRLVAEEGLDLEEILVVTFTRAATAELKGRIRGRMVRTFRALEGAPGTESSDVDEHMEVLLGGTPEQRRRSAARLDEALTRFDRAQVFTIHGFAQRLLTQLGFRSRLPTDLEPGEIDDLLLRRAAGDLVVGRFAAGGTGIEKAATSEIVAIGRAVVGTPDALIVPAPADVDGVPRMRTEMALEMRDVVPRRMRSAGMITFDDGLMEARAALTDPELGAEARAMLQDRYAVALVDESQDTDPIQWQVLRAVFDESRLVVIGDPKQSIYAFRGADVESYLAAADSATARLTLETNWRSDGPLLTALDALFAGASFGDERISYSEVRPAHHHGASRISGAGAPLQVRRFSSDLPLPRYLRKPTFRVGGAREAVATDVAAEIVRLLTSGATLTDGSGERPVGPGDIAVLCRTRSQVDMVRRELFARGVPSVAARAGGVFATTAAAEAWRRFLLAVEHPARIDYVRMAATTLLVGRSLSEVAALDDDEVLALQRSFHDWQALLNEHGVPALFREVDRTTDLTARVLAAPDGERTMTDLTHIAEEMHAAWRRGRVGSLTAWLEAAMDEAERNAKANVDDADARQRRLETDAAAVQVQTIHAAKGLEYPIVMAPYLWDIPDRKPGIPVFHGPGPAAPGRPRPRRIDVGGSDWPDFDADQAAAIEEDVAEEGRLLYVALTRARHLVVLWWIENTARCADTKLHELLTRGDPTGADVGWLIEAADGTIDQSILTEPAPLNRYVPEESRLGHLERAHLDRSLDYAWRRVSFSSLSPEHPLDGDADTTEQPDRADETVVGEDAPPAAGGEPAMADLPRGARFGSLVHEILERVPFSTPNLVEALHDQLADATRNAAWDFDADVFVAGMAAALETPLGPGRASPALRDLDAGRVRKEMRFELPVRTEGAATSLREVGAVMLEHLRPDDPHRSYAERLGALEPSRFHGYLTGAIDLTTSMPGPDGDRYYVMDFKSNALPARDGVSTVSDYGPGPLVAAMHAGNYVLQALLYQIALHRYLQLRLAGYDPVTHLGGSMYLFVRGMVGATAPVIDGERAGVSRWSPPPDMIVAVSDLFARGGP